MERGIIIIFFIILRLLRRISSGEKEKGEENQYLEKMVHRRILICRELMININKEGK